MKSLLFFKLTSLLTLLLLCGAMITPVYAGAGLEKLNEGLQKTGEAINPSGKTNVETTTNLPTFIGRAVNTMFVVVGFVFLAIAVTGGLIWMTAGGNEEKVGKGKKFIGQGIDGLIVMFFAYAFIYLVLQALNAGAGG